MIDSIRDECFVQINYLTIASFPYHWSLWIHQKITCWLNLELIFFPLIVWNRVLHAKDHPSKIGGNRRLVAQQKKDTHEKRTTEFELNRCHKYKSLPLHIRSVRRTKKSRRPLKAEWRMDEKVYSSLCLSFSFLICRFNCKTIIVFSKCFSVQTTTT